MLIIHTLEQIKYFILLYTTHNVVQMAEIIFVKAESPFPD